MMEYAKFERMLIVKNAKIVRRLIQEYAEFGRRLIPKHADLVRMPVQDYSKFVRMLIGDNAKVVRMPMPEYAEFVRMLIQSTRSSGLCWSARSWGTVARGFSGPVYGGGGGGRRVTVDEPTGDEDGDQEEHGAVHEAALRVRSEVS